MRFFLMALALLAGACSPTFDWREVRAPGGLKALLPCKPDEATREVALAEPALPLQMMGCPAGGVMFAVSRVELGPTLPVAEALRRWEAATLSNLKGQATARAAFAPAGAASGIRVSARGQDAAGQAVQGEIAWFTRGPVLWQAVMYAPKLPAEAADTFFSGLAIP